MIRVVKFYILVFLVVSSLLTISFRAEAVNKIRFATVAPDGTALLNELQAFGREIKEKTGGEVELKIYHTGKMGDEKDVLRKMRSNQLHGGGFTGFGLGEVHASIRIMEMPFLFRSREELDYVFDKMYPTFLKLFDQKGYVLMGTGDAGDVHLFSKDPLRNRDNLKTTKMWVWEGDPLATEFFRSANASPIPLPLTEVVTALQTGMVNGFYVPPSIAIGLQWKDKVNYITFPKLNNVAGGIMLTKKKWATLTPGQQKIILKASDKLGSRLTLVARQDNEQAIAKLKSEKFKFVDMDKESQDYFFQLSQDVQKQLTGKLFSQSILNQVQQLLRDYRAKKKAS